MNTIERKAILILAIAFLLRFYFVFIYPQFPVASDAKEYDSLGWNIAAGNGFTDEAGKAELHRSPGYPFFLAVIYRVFGHSYDHVRSFQVLISMLTLLLIFLIAKDIFGKDTALFSLTIASFYPPFISYCGILYNETLFTFLIALSAYLFLYAIRHSSARVYILLGVTGGYAILLREEFILVLLSFLVLTVVYSRENLKKIICLILGALLIIAPWTIRNYKVSGEFVLVSSQLGPILWISSYKGGWTEWHFEDPYYKSLVNGLSKFERNKLLLSEGIKNIKEVPLRYLKFCFKGLARFWIAGHSNTFYGLRDSFKNYLSAGASGKVVIKALFPVFNTILIILGGYGALMAIKKLRNKVIELLFLILPVFMVMTVHFFLFGADRYQVPIMPLMIMFAAFGLFSLQQKRIEAG